jgi:Fe-coproporphyrin III synthase
VGLSDVAAALPRPLVLARQAAELASSVVRTRMGWRDQPRLLTYIVTFRCNARCVMCDSWQKQDEDELTLAEIDGIFRQLPPLHAVRLTGGEPFVRKDFADIARLTLIRLRPSLLHVTSNGFLTDRIVAFCEQRDRRTPLELLISIDGVEAKHDEIRGRKHAWDQAFGTVSALAPRQRELNLRLAVNQTVVDAEGAQQYRELRDRLRPLGVRNQVVIAYQASATYSLTREIDVAPRHSGSFATFGDLEGDCLSTLFDQIEEDLADYPLPERVAKRYYLDGIRGRLLEGHHQPNPPCVALGAHLRLFPNGDVPTCQFNTRRVGNLRATSFAELWRGEDAVRQRDWVRRCPGCWAECEVVPNALYSGDLFRMVRAARR